MPTYLQLVHQVEQALRLGYLARGDQLPRVKDVVGTLAINPNTVLKAYRELEHRGIAAGRPGQGTFVQAAAGDCSARGAERAAEEPARLAARRGFRRAGCGRDGRVVHRRPAGFP